MATCPAGGTRLLKHTTTRPHTTPHDWFSCSICGGIWIPELSFFSLHIEQLEIPLPSGQHRHHLLHPTCPTCRQHLSVVHASKLSCPLYTIWHCPTKKHGYFVPFASLEKLQNGYKHAKRTIHIAFAPIGFSISIIIAALFYMFLTFITVGNIHPASHAVSNPPIVTHRVYPDTLRNFYVFTVETRTQTKLILDLDASNETRSYHMDTTDGLHHVAKVHIIEAPDSYSYSFRSTDTNSRWKSEWFTF